MYYKKVDLPSDEPVQYVGVYVLEWENVVDGSLVEPTVGFVEVDDAADDEIISCVDDMDIWSERQWRSATVVTPDGGDE